MLKIFIWYFSKDLKYRADALKILKRQHGSIKLIGSSTNSKLAKVDWGGADVVLVVGAKKNGMSKVTQIAVKFKLDTEKLLGDWIVCIPGFTLRKYRELQNSHLSIFAVNCFGGIISRMLALPFRSPFINMFLKGQEYVHFLRSPRVHMEEQLILKGTAYNEILKINYPIVTLGDVDLYMNHYPDLDEAIAKWNERRQKINWDNLFVTMYTENEGTLREFDALPYDKKACFVPFKSDLNSAWYIDPKIDFDREYEGFWDVINNFARGKIFYYDVFDMLLYGKKTPLIDM